MAARLTSNQKVTGSSPVMEKNLYLLCLFIIPMLLLTSLQLSQRKRTVYCMHVTAASISFGSPAAKTNDSCVWSAVLSFQYRHLQRRTYHSRCCTTPRWCHHVKDIHRTVCWCHLKGSTCSNRNCRWRGRRHTVVIVPLTLMNPLPVRNNNAYHSHPY